MFFTFFSLLPTKIEIMEGKELEVEALAELLKQEMHKRKTWQ